MVFISSKLFFLFLRSFFRNFSRSSPPEVFLGRRVLKICSKFTGEHSCQSAICNFIEVALHHECYPVNLLHILRTHFPKNSSKKLRFPLPLDSNGHINETGIIMTLWIGLHKLANVIF